MSSGSSPMMCGSNHRQVVGKPQPLAYVAAVRNELTDTPQPPLQCEAQQDRGSKRLQVGTTLTAVLLRLYHAERNKVTANPEPHPQCETVVVVLLSPRRQAWHKWTARTTDTTV